MNNHPPTESVHVLITIAEKQNDKGGMLEAISLLEHLPDIPNKTFFKERFQRSKKMFKKLFLLLLVLTINTISIMPFAYLDNDYYKSEA